MSDTNLRLKKAEEAYETQSRQPGTRRYFIEDSALLSHEDEALIRQVTLEHDDERGRAQVAAETLKST